MTRRLFSVLLAGAQGLVCVAAGAAVLLTSVPEVAGGSVAAPSVGPSLTITVTEPALVSRPTRSRVAAAPTARRPAVQRKAAKPVVRPAVARRTAVARKPAPKPAPAPKVVVVAAPAPKPVTKQEQMNQAVARIPGGADPKVVWVLSDAYGSWGTADWYNDIVYISPKVPENRMYDVVIHEYNHLRSVVPYGGNVDDAVKAMNAYFGGSGLMGAERAADCMARLQGATWTSYTPCTDARWRDGARKLVRGQRL